MTILHINDADTGNTIPVDLDSPQGSINTIDAVTGEIVEIDLESSTGLQYVIDADTGEYVLVDGSNLSGTLSIIDANTGETVTLDLSNPNGTVNVIDSNTGEFVELDLSQGMGIIRLGQSTVFIRPEEGEEPTYHLSFDGNTDYILVPASASLEDLPLGSFTVEWVGTSTWLEGFSQEVVYKAGGEEIGWEIIRNDATLSFWINFDEEYVLYVSRGIDVSALTGPHHFECVFIPSPRQMKIFVDGVEASYTESTTDTTGTYPGDSGKDLDIYGNAPAGYDNQGLLNWVRISNIARHTSNFTAPSLTVAPAADGNTVLLLALDEGTGTTANDTSGNNNNGTITGATWVQD